MLQFLKKISGYLVYVTIIISTLKFAIEQIENLESVNKPNDQLPA